MGKRTTGTPRFLGENAVRMISDLRLALRGMWRSPGFAISAILILALGVGANTGAFSAIHTLLLAPLPYPQPEGLVTLYETGADQKPRGVAEANLLDWRVRSDAFAGMAAFGFSIFVALFELWLRRIRPRLTGGVSALLFAILIFSTSSTASTCSI